MKTIKRRILMCLMALALVAGLIAPCAPAQAAADDAGTIVAKALKKLQSAKTISFSVHEEASIENGSETETNVTEGICMSDDMIDYGYYFSRFDERLAWIEYGTEGIVFRKYCDSDHYGTYYFDEYREKEKTQKKSLEYILSGIKNLKIKKTSAKYYTITGESSYEDTDEGKVTLLIGKKSGKIVKVRSQIRNIERYYLNTDDVLTIKGGFYVLSNIGYSEVGLSLPAELTKELKEASRIYVLDQSMLAYGWDLIACDGEKYYSGDGVGLSCFDDNLESSLFADNLLEGLDGTGQVVDIDVNGDELYAGAQLTAEGDVSRPQIVIFDAGTFKPKKSFGLDAASGQKDITGIAADPDNKCIWLSSSNGKYLYAYTADTGAFIRKVKLKSAPENITGIAYYDGWIYISSVNGSACLYRCQVNPDADSFKVFKERELPEIFDPGDHVSIAFDDARDRMLIAANGLHIYDMTVVDHPLDYSESTNWVSLPGVEELADPSKKADVFMVLPTINMNKFKPGNTDPTNLREALRFTKTFNMEKGILDDAAAIYSPLYRQTTIGSFLGEDGLIDFSDVSDTRKVYDDIAYADIRNAWLYYMKNCNNDRPVVLFGYSQGGDMVKRLLEEFGDDSAFKEKLVAAYVIGSSVTGEDIAKYPHLSMARGEKDTGVIISFNAVDARMEMTGTKELSINPLNWKTDSTPAPAKKNLGMVTANTWGVETSETPAYCGAYIDSASGKLVVTDIEGQDELFGADNGVFRKGDYHTYDLNMFYRNLEKNVQTRINEFCGK